MSYKQRSVISVRIVGAVHRDKPKLKMFMICVSRSDDTDIIIYRSFKDFQKNHKQLKKRFPHMNPFCKKDRLIPKFRGQVRKGSHSQKGSKRFIQRMKFLESYCDKLLKCDQTVTQSSELTQFFMPKDHDLQPDFTKNSIMILLSDDLPDGSGGGGGDVTGQSAGSITHPLSTQTYRCVAAYETKDTKNLPFKVAVDEKLDVLIRDTAGWWLVENEEKRLAWFPAPYLELWDEDDVGFQFAGSLYCVVRSYSTKNHDEVSVLIGSVVEVLRKSDDGWWFIRFNGKSGYFPSMNLKPYKDPRAGLCTLQRKLHSSILNLATPPASPPRINQDNSPRPCSAGQSRGEPHVPGHLNKPHYPDLLYETCSRSQMEGRDRILSDTNTEFSFSFPSPSSSCAGSSPTVSDSGRSSLHFSLSNINSDSYGSLGCSETASVTPKVPSRPRREEILTRCTTMTRKAALTNKTRLRNHSTHRRNNKPLMHEVLM